MDGLTDTASSDDDLEILNVVKGNFDIKKSNESRQKLQVRHCDTLISASRSYDKVPRCL